jgi:hypothetical protein
MKRGRPIVVRVGNVSIPIYVLRDGRFAVVYRPAPKAKRVVLPYKLLAKAKQVAQEKAIAIAVLPDEHLDAAGARKVMQMRLAIAFR